MNVPASTIPWHNRSYSSWLPSAQTTLSGLQSAAISATQSRSLPLVVGLFRLASILLSLPRFHAIHFRGLMQSDIFFTTTGLMHVAFLFAANHTPSKYKEFFQLASRSLGSTSRVS